jgi:hypothetical protein
MNPRHALPRHALLRHALPRRALLQQALLQHALLRRRRDGASLAITLAALILIKCVILGTLHLALLERQLGTGAIAVLRLRLAADAALATAMAAWPDDSDRLLLPGAAATGAAAESTDGLRVQASWQRVGPALYLLRAEAREPPPRAGVAAAAMLVLPPLFPPDFDPADWMAAAGNAGADPALDSLLHRIRDGTPARLRADPAAVLLLDADANFDGDFVGVLVARGDLTLAAGAAVTGAIIVAGRLTLAPGAAATGAILALALHDDAAGFSADPAVAEAAIRGARLHVAVPAAGRARLPAF